MDVNWQDAFNILVLVCGSMGGWVLGRITKSLDRLDDDVRALPDKYVSKADYHADILEIKTTMRRIYEKLDGKADK